MIPDHSVSGGVLRQIRSAHRDFEDPEFEAAKTRPREQGKPMKGIGYPFIPTRVPALALRIRSVCSRALPAELTLQRHNGTLARRRHGRKPGR